MSKCLRCGGVCADNEQMCDNCKAWFQQRTGGQFASAGNYKKNNNPIKNDSLPPAAVPDKNTSAPHINTPAAASGHQGTDVRQKNTVRVENTAESESKVSPRAVVIPSNLNDNHEDPIPPKPFNIKLAAGIAVAVALVLISAAIVATVITRNKEQARSADSSAAGTFGSTDKNLPDASPADAADAENGENLTSEIQEQVNTINRYVTSTQLAYSGSNYTTLSEGDVSWNFIDDQLVEAYTAVSAYTTDENCAYEADYFYNDGSPCYVYLSGGPNEEINTFYLANDSVIYWIDNQNQGHTPGVSDDIEDWEVLIDEAYALSDYSSGTSTSGTSSSTSASAASTSSSGTDTNTEYIFPHSDTELLSRSDLEGLSAWELRLGRNEIMARHGREFKNEDIRAYFLGCSWYTPSVDADTFDNSYESRLNDIEKANANLILSYEKEKGYVN